VYCSDLTGGIITRDVQNPLVVDVRVLSIGHRLHRHDMLAVIKCRLEYVHVSVLVCVEHDRQRVLDCALLIRRVHFTDTRGQKRIMTDD
jgi:hypothetical protein